MTPTRWLVLPVLLLAGGCRYAVNESIDQYIAGRATLSIDPDPRPMIGGAVVPALLLTPAADTTSRTDTDAGIVRQTAFLQAPEPGTAAQGKKDFKDFLELDKTGIPGANVPPVKMPRPNEPKEKFNEALQKYFPPLPSLPQMELPGLSPDGRPLTLDDLQRLAVVNNPQVRLAAADVEAARGAARQAGLPPNPQFGYEADSMRQANTAGIIGGYAQQTIVTAGKLHLAQLSATMDLRVAEQRLHGAETDLQAQVRQNYFTVLAARENLRANLALAKLTDKMYDLLLLQLRSGISSPYEVYGLRVIAQQTRSTVVQARNRSTSAWRQLAIVIGQPNLPPTQLTGRVDMPIPVFHLETALDHVLQGHTDVIAARAAVEKARYQLKLAQVQPIPNVDVRLMLQKDYTTAPYGAIPSVQVNVPIPVWDRNQGGIYQAEALLVKAIDDQKRVELTLRNRLTDAFERYETNRVQLELFRDQILPGQVQAFRGLVGRYVAEGDKGTLNYNDLVTGEQTLVTVVNSYLGQLRDQWTAVVDIAALLQTHDLFQVETRPVAPVPEIDGLMPPRR